MSFTSLKLSRSIRTNENRSPAPSVRRARSARAARFGKHVNASVRAIRSCSASAALRLLTSLTTPTTSDRLRRPGSSARSISAHSVLPSPVTRRASTSPVPCSSACSRPARTLPGRLGGPAPRPRPRSWAAPSRRRSSMAASSADVSSSLVSGSYSNQPMPPERSASRLLRSLLARSGQGDPPLLDEGRGRRFSLQRSAHKQHLDHDHSGHEPVGIYRVDENAGR